MTFFVGDLKIKYGVRKIELLVGKNCRVSKMKNCQKW